MLGNAGRAAMRLAVKCKEREFMDLTMRNSLVIALSIAATLGVTSLVSQTRPAQAASASLIALDPDKDGTVDLAEAKAAGAKVFAKLDPDKDGTLDAKELEGRVDAAALKTADPDSDGTLDAKEYASLVEARFKAADPDNDGTLDEKELGTDAGKAFLKLVE
jgi:EF hand